MSDKLMDLAAEYRAVFEKLNDMDIDEQVVSDTLESLAVTGTLEQSATSLIAWVEGKEAEAEVIKKRRALMLARQQALENRAARGRAYVFNAMKLAQIKVIETPEYKLRVKGGAAKVIIDAPSQVPPIYMRFPDPPAPEIDKEKIRDILTAAAKASALFNDGKPISAEQTAAIDLAKEIDFAHLEQIEFLDVR